MVLVNICIFFNVWDLKMVNFFSCPCLVVLKGYMFYALIIQPIQLICEINIHHLCAGASLLGCHCYSSNVYNFNLFV